jgi:hypothetical protein
MTTPNQFVDTYHLLPVQDARMDLDVTLKIQKYEAGWLGQDLATSVLDAVARKCCKLKNGNQDLKPIFHIEHDARVDPSEVFYAASIRRAFGSRGSPDEIRDALRLAVLGDVVKRGNAMAKGQEWFGQDCNSFVANYLGVSPMIGVKGYAKGNVTSFSKGRDRSLEDCVRLFPLPVREHPRYVADEDVIVTYGPWVDLDRGHWRHIALVQSITVAENPIRMEGKAGIYNAWISLTEYGGKIRAKDKVRQTGIEVINDIAHWVPRKDPNNKLKELVGALAKELPGKTLVGFQGDFDGAPAIRFFLDPSRITDQGIRSRGWHIAGQELGH